MKGITKILTGAAAAAALTATMAVPAQAQSWDRRDRDGIDVGDIVTGVAVIGGIAAILGAFDRDRDRYGHDNRYRYRDGYQTAVNACSYEAQRYGRGGNVQITDVDRRSNDRYRVEGVIQAGYGGYGHDRYDRRYDSRYDRRYNRYDQRVEFECTARGNGRVTDFDIDRRRY